MLRSACIGSEGRCGRSAGRCSSWWCSAAPTATRSPGLHGKALAVTVALCVFAVTLLIAIRDGFPERSVELQTAVIAVMGAAGVAIAGLQPQGSDRGRGRRRGVHGDHSAAVQRRCRDRWRGDRRARCGHGGGRKLLVGCRGRDAGDGRWSASSRSSSSSLGRARTGPRSCWRSSRTRAMSRPARRRSPSAAGSPPSCTTCSRTRSPAPRSSSRAPGSSPSASTLSRL